MIPVGSTVRLLVNLPGQSAGNHGEVVSYDPLKFVMVEFSDGSRVILMHADVEVMPTDEGR